jgi:hypothetical protein
VATDDRVWFSIIKIVYILKLLYEKFKITLGAHLVYALGMYVREFRFQLHGTLYPVNYSEVSSID